MEEKINIQIMTNIQIWCWWLLVLIQNIHSTSPQAQFMSFCNQPLNMSSSPLSIMYTPSLYPSCCNVTLVSDLSEQIMINISNLSTTNPSLKIYNKQNEMIKLQSYLLSDRTYLKSDAVNLPIIFSLCQFNISSFEILITNVPKDSTSKSPQKVGRAIRGGIITTTIIFGLLLIICSVSIALAFVYFRRKNQRRRQFTYSLESTSDDWEPSGTGYHLFDNLTNHRRHTEHNIDNVIIDANEHMPIATNMTNR